jgi:alpha-galactosidase
LARSIGLIAATGRRGTGTGNGQPKGASVDRRYFLKVLAVGTGSAALVADGYPRPTPAGAQATPAGDTADAVVSEFIANPPFSFNYAGQWSAGLLPRWRAERRKISSTPGRSEEKVTWRAPSGELEVEAVVVVYESFGATEWTVSFANPSSTTSQRLSEVLAADTIINGSPTAPYVLHHFNGSAQQADDYAPQTSLLTLSEAQLLSPMGGRPSNGTWPYFNIAWGGQGVMVAVGWPGQWTTELLVDEQEGLRLRAGMTSADPLLDSYEDIVDARLLDTSLEPGEEVRTPLIVLMSWSADSWLLAQNKWRRWMIDYNLPRFGGTLPEPIIPTTGGLSLLPNHAEELSAIESYVRRGTTRDRGGFYTHWWVDAGWYAIPSVLPQNWGNGVGNWFPDPKRFPNGMRPTFQRAMDHGMKSVLWSEPERVGVGTELFEKHPDWLTPPPDPDADASYLLDFGNADAWAWSLERFDTIITNQAAQGHELDVFRQDFNMDPLDYWNARDIPGRIGMTQVKHVAGHLAFWDELRKRHPHLWIDSCASGGRRNDLETMRRSIPLLRSDYQFEPTGNQCQTYGLSLWFPYYGTGVGPQSTNDGVWGPGQYVVRSSLAPSYASSVDVGTASEDDWALLRTMNEEFVRIKDDLLYSDFYPLTGFSLENDVWMALQFDRPAAGSGVVLVFRRPDAQAATMRFVLQGLDAARQYRIENFDRSGNELTSGKSLMRQGLDISLPDAPGSAIVHYERQSSRSA